MMFWEISNMTTNFIYRITLYSSFPLWRMQVMGMLDKANLVTKISICIYVADRLFIKMQLTLISITDWL